MLSQHLEVLSYACRQASVLLGAAAAGECIQGVPKMPYGVVLLHIELQATLQLDAAPSPASSRYDTNTCMLSCTMLNTKP